MRYGIEAERSPEILISPDETINHKTGNFNYSQAPLYFRAVNDAGGLSSMLPVETSAAKIVEYYENYDGIVLSGGLDVNPAIYGAEAHPTSDPGSEENDLMALQLLEMAERDGKPVLAICRGMQLLNIARGGSLYQHLPDAFGDGIDHRNLQKDSDSRHEISVDRTSRLGGIMLPYMVEGDRLNVNSYHHQGIDPDRLGSDLKVVAKSPDGVIEAVETTNPNHFLLGVQWHPESMKLDESFGELFVGFVQAVRDYRASRLEVAALAA